MSDKNTEAREALYDALQEWITKYDRAGSDSILTKAFLILEIQEPQRRHRTLCYRTLDLNFTGLYSWDCLGMLMSALETTKDMARETHYDADDPPPGDLEDGADQE